MSLNSIWTPLSAEDSELCQPVDPADYERLNLEINGNERSDTWRSPVMQIIREDEGQRLTESDSPWLGEHALIFRPATVLAMGTMLRRFGELLPLKCASARLHIYNPTLVLDALDEDSSSLLRVDSGRIMMINRYEFRPELIRDVDVFKIPNLRVSPTFVGTRFVDAWQSAGLRGLDFKKVWDAP